MENALTQEEASELISALHTAHVPITYGLSKKLFAVAQIEQREPYVMLKADASEREIERLKKELLSMGDSKLVYI